MKKLSITCVLMLTMLCSFSVSMASTQDIHYVDSLISEAVEIQDYNPDSAIVFARKALSLSENLDYAIGKFNALTCLCFSSYLRGNYKEATEYGSRSIEIGSPIKEQVELSKPYHYLALIQVNNGQSKKALELLDKTVELALEEQNNFVLADAYENIGMIHVNKQTYDQAANYFHRSLSVHEIINHPVGKFFVFVNFSRLQMEIGAYDSANFYLDQSINLAKKLKNDRILVHSYNLKGKLGIETNTLLQAEEYLLKGTRIADSLNLNWARANLYATLTEVFYLQSKYNNAIQYGKRAMEIAEEANIMYILQNVNNILAKSYMKSEDFSEAEKYINNLQDLMDSITSSEHKESIQMIVDNNYIEQETQNIEIVSKELAIAQAKIQQRNNLLIWSAVATGLMLIIVILFYRSYSIKKKNYEQLKTLNDQIESQKQELEKTNKKLNNLNKEKDILMGMVAHDIRSPLNQISGLVNIAQLESTIDESQDIVFEKIQQTLSDANQLADELLEINKLEAGVLQTKKDHIDLYEFVEQVVIPFQKLASKKHIDIRIQRNCENCSFGSDKKIIQRVFENLISNAIKFSNPYSAIQIEFRRYDDGLVFNVIDHGQGIPESEQQIIFSKFGKTSTRPTDGEPSNGLGLYIVYQLLNSISGEISFESEEGKGSNFMFSIPTH